MEYITFREAFCEHIVTYLPPEYKNIKIETKTSIDNLTGKVNEQAYLKYDEIELCHIKLHHLFDTEREKIEQIGVELYLEDLADSLKEFLHGAYEKHHIVPEMSYHENHMLCKKEGKIYDCRCIKIDDTLQNLDVFQKIAEREKSDLIILPYEKQLIIISEQEIIRENLNIDEFLKELKWNMMCDMDHSGNYILLYNMGNHAIQSIDIQV